MLCFLYRCAKPVKITLCEGNRNRPAVHSQLHDPVSRDKGRFCNLNIIELRVIIFFSRHDDPVIIEQNCRHIQPAVKLVIHTATLPESKYKNLTIL